MKLTKWEIENALRDTEQRLFLTIIYLRKLARKTTDNNLLDSLFGLTESLRVSLSHTQDVLEDCMVGDFDSILEED